MSQVPCSPNHTPLIFAESLPERCERGRLPHSPIHFGVEQETPRVWSLRMAPVELGQIAAALAGPATDRLMLVSGKGPHTWARQHQGATLLPMTLLPRLSAPIEVIHIAQGTTRAVPLQDIPTSLLADPEAAVPSALGSRFSLSIQDGCHGLLFTADHDLLRRCLRTYLQSYQELQAGPSVSLPPLTDDLLASLLEPVSPGEYREACFHPGRLICTMHISLLEAGAPVPIHETRWVSSAENGEWRAGWSW